MPSMTFDEYCAEHSISIEELPAAFGAYLNYLSGWDGNTVEVTSTSHVSEEADRG